MNNKMSALAGAAGIAAGILLAPDKGSRTVQKLSVRGKKLIAGMKKSAKGDIKKLKKRIREKSSQVKNAIRTHGKTIAKAALNGRESLHRKVSRTLIDAAKALGDTNGQTTTRKITAKKSLQGQKQLPKSKKPKKDIRLSSGKSKRVR